MLPVESPPSLTTLPSPVMLPARSVREPSSSPVTFGALSKGRPDGGFCNHAMSPSEGERSFPLTGALRESDAGSVQGDVAPEP